MGRRVAAVFATVWLVPVVPVMARPDAAVAAGDQPVTVDLSTKSDAVGGDAGAQSDSFGSATPTARTTDPNAMWRASLAALDQYRASRAGTAEIAIADLSAGVVSGVGDQAPLRSASIIKVAVALAALRDAERNLRELTGSERAALDAAIRTSDNDATTYLWNRSGGARGLVETAAAAGLQSTSPDPGGAWGFTLTTARDQAQLLWSLYSGQLVNASHTEVLIGLMRGVAPEQRWGLAAGAPTTWRPAIKNGWYPDTDEPVWRVHCLAIFDDVALARSFAAAVLTRYPQDLGIEYGKQTCQDVAAHLTNSSAAISYIGAE